MTSLFPLLFNDVDQMLGTLGGNGTQSWVPAADVIETDDELIARLDVPGLREDDLELVVEDGILTIAGERGRAEEGNALRLERATGRFERMMRLPTGVEPDAIKADIDDGVLEIRIAKPDTLKPHRVEIGGGQRQLEAAAA